MCLKLLMRRWKMMSNDNPIEKVEEEMSKCKHEETIPVGPGIRVCFRCLEEVRG